MTTYSIKILSHSLIARNFVDLFSLHIFETGPEGPELED
jgi:hypothetical protein